ncbi:TPA: hypothetical protein RSW61_001929 [Vibrio harveyi]|nr:hypothetical protein [Vibrio harveyi]
MKYRDYLFIAGMTGVILSDGVTTSGVLGCILSLFAVFDALKEKNNERLS